MLSEMGSVALAGPMFALLRQRYPGATLHVLQLKKNQEVAAMLGLAAPQHLHGLDDSSGLSLMQDIWRVCRAMRALPLDAIIDCELFSRIQPAFLPEWRTTAGRLYAAHPGGLVPGQAP